MVTLTTADNALKNVYLQILTHYLQKLNKQPPMYGGKIL